MNSKKIKWVNNPWFIAFICYLILAPIGSAIYDHTKTIPFLTILVLKPLNYLWNLALPLYVVIIASFVTGFLVRNHFVFKIKLKEEMDNHPVKPHADYLSWTQDRLKRWVWSWEWYYNPNTNNYEVSGFKPICHKCQFKMYNDPGYAIYKCPNCDNIYAGDSFENWYDIKSIINQRIERGDFPKLNN